MNSHYGLKPLFSETLIVGVIYSLKYSTVGKLRLQGTCVVHGFRETPKSDGNRYGWRIWSETLKSRAQYRFCKAWILIWVR